jgi:MFS family permease
MLATLVLFFVAFNLLEASLPSLVAKMAPAAAKGTAMGFFTSSQFIGAFAGGLLGGWFHQSAGVEGVFLLGAGTSLLWFLVVLGLSDPTYLSNRLLRVGVLTEEEAAYMASRLSAVPGVAEAVVVAQDGVAYLKVDRSTLDESELARLSVVSA